MEVCKIKTISAKGWEGQESFKDENNPDSLASNKANDEFTSLQFHLQFNETMINFK